MLRFFRRRRDPKTRLAEELHATRAKLEELLAIIAKCERHLADAKPEAAERQFHIA
jgi:hypothetical protein